MGVAPLRNCGTAVVTDNNKNASGVPISAEDKAMKDLAEGKVDNISIAPTDEKKVRETNVSLWSNFLKDIINMKEAKNDIKKIELDDNVLKNTKTSDQAKGIFINQSNVNKFVDGEGDFKTYLSEYINSPDFDMVSADALTEKNKKTKDKYSFTDIKKLKSGANFNEVKAIYDKVIEKTREAVANNVLKNIMLKIMDNDAFKQQLNPANVPQGPANAPPANAPPANAPAGGGDDDDDEEKKEKEEDNSSVSSGDTIVTNSSDEEPEEEEPETEEEEPETEEEKTEETETAKEEEGGGWGKTPAQKAEKEAANASKKLAKDQAAVTKESNKQAAKQKESDDENTKKIFNTKQKEFLSDLLSIKTFTDANRAELLNVWDGKSLDKTKLNEITPLANKIYDNINTYVKPLPPVPAPVPVLVPGPVPAPVLGQDAPNAQPVPVDTNAQPASVDTNAQPVPVDTNAQPAPVDTNAQPASVDQKTPYVKPEPSAPPPPPPELKTGGQNMSGGGSLKKKKRFTRKKPQRIHININVGDNNNVKEDSSSSDSNSNSDSDSDDDDDKPKITYNKKM